MMLCAVDSVVLKVMIFNNVILDITFSCRSPCGEDDFRSGCRNINHYNRQQSLLRTALTYTIRLNFHIVWREPQVYVNEVYINFLYLWLICGRIVRDNLPPKVFFSFQECSFWTWFAAIPPWESKLSAIFGLFFLSFTPSELRGK